MADSDLQGSLDMLRDSFSAVVSDGEFGIFAIGIGEIDPDFSAGSVVLFAGADGWFTATSPRMDAAVLADLADVLKSASIAIDRLWILRSAA